MNNCLFFSYILKLLSCHLSKIVKVSVFFLLFTTFSLFFAVYSCDNQLSFSFVSLSSAHAYSVELLACHRGEFWMHSSANLEH